MLWNDSDFSLFTGIHCKIIILCSPKIFFLPILRGKSAKGPDLSGCESKWNVLLGTHIAERVPLLQGWC